MLDTFSSIRRKDDAAYDKHRTKRVILEIHDDMTEANLTYMPYHTKLDHPPSHSCEAHSIMAKGTA